MTTDSYPVRLALLVLVALTIAGGQALLQQFARGFPGSIGAAPLYVLSSLPLWGAAILYCFGVGGYLILLRRFELVEVNLPIILLLVLFTLLIDAALGRYPSPTQWIGVALAVAGLIAIVRG